MKKLICFEFNDKQEADDIYSQISNNSEVRILEFGQRNFHKIILLAEGTNFNFKYNGSYFIFNDPHKELLPAYFKLLTPQLEHNLCILSSDSLIQLFVTTDKLMKDYSYEGIEIYRGKNSCQKAQALICNGDKQFSIPEECHQVSYKMIKNPNDFVISNFF